MDVTDAQLLGDQLIVVPNVTAWQCDVCGDFAYDDQTLARVDFLLGSSMERSGTRRPQRSRSGPGSPAADDSKQKLAR
jgi:YgiT-type zinc finger domain-containing protein